MRWPKWWGIKGLIIGGVAWRRGGEAGLKGARETVDGRWSLGDIITAVDGKPVGTLDELMDTMEHHKVNDQVMVELLRGTRRERVSVTLQAVN
jgi:S1-C subfamily serine protease